MNVMKNSKVMLLFFCASLYACNGKEKKENKEERKNIDTSVVGKDYSPATLRNDIEMSDEKKQSVPGMTGDSMKTDKPNRNERGEENPAH
jgi:hypothetical protein